MKKTLFFLFLAALLFCYSLRSDAQYIYTVAGNDTPGYSGDGGPAIAAKLNEPGPGAVDNFGNIYIVDNGNNAIREINTSGIITTIAGNGTAGYSGDGGPATAAQLSSPQGLTVDNEGNVYIADGNNVIRKVNTSGIINTIAGTGVSGYNGTNGVATSIKLNEPNNVGVDNKGNVYITDGANNMVRLVDSFGFISTIAGTHVAGYSGDGGPATAAQLDFPYGLAIDPTGNIFISEWGNNVVRKIGLSGIISTVAGNGTAGYSGDGGPATSAQFYEIPGVSVDADSNIYIADVGNNVVRKVNSSGIVNLFAGTGAYGYSGDGGLAILAELYYPFSVVSNSSGTNVYIGDNFNNVIRCVGPLPTYINTITNSVFAKLVIAPNPAEDILTVEITGINPQKILIEVTNITGITLFEKEVENYQLGSSISLNIEDFAPGMYFITAKIGTQQYASKFVKK